MTQKQRYREVITWFEENVPVAESELHFQNAYQLLVAVVLSAQCTDKRINQVTPTLFSRFPTVAELAEADFDELFELVRTVSYPRNKTQHLIGLARKIRDDYEGIVPSEVEELMTLPGVGRKSANVVASIIFGKPVIAVDTHVMRVAKRLGLSSGNTPDAVEADLEKGIPADRRAISHHWLILHGRYICTARTPNCVECGLRAFCKTASKNTEI